MATGSSPPSFSVSFAKLVATVGPAGYSPVAPGTVGTAAAVPLVWATAGLSCWTYGLFTLGVVVVAVIAAGAADRAFGEHDSQRIVIDEVAGYCVTMITVPRAVPWLLGVGFVVFRLLDIYKPPGARWIDRRLPGGPGVVLDDVVAGLYGAVILWLLWRSGIRP